MFGKRPKPSWLPQAAKWPAHPPDPQPGKGCDVHNAHSRYFGEGNRPKHSWLPQAKWPAQCAHPPDPQPEKGCDVHIQDSFERESGSRSLGNNVRIAS